MAECAVEYRIYIEKLIICEGDETTDGLERRWAEILAFVSTLIGDYIWQNEAFSLGYATTPGVKTGDIPVHLWGQTNYGDNIDDEWFIVFLLVQLTVKFADVCVSVCDSDGQFLLIEAAHFLPKWLTPEASENRVFIKGGSVHIIPLPSSPREITVYPTGTPLLLNAVQLIFGCHNTLAVPKIQQAIHRRINGYPAQALHHAHVYIPPAVKHVLDHKPSLISPAIQTFYSRDPVDVKACREMKMFPPKDRVMTKACFTRCLYAQLMQQDFQPDKRSPWELPSPSNPRYKAHELGMKLTCGFEILCTKSGLMDSQGRENPCGPKWDRFLSCLTKQGFFKGEIKGSHLYTKLMNDAQRHFQESFDSRGTSKSDAGSEVLSMLQYADIDISKMRAEEEHLPDEDDDKWLEISPEELDTMLQRYRAVNGRTHPTSVTSGDKEGVEPFTKEEFDIECVTHTMKAFVDKVSSHEGAEFPGEEDGGEVEFDADSFMDTMKTLLVRSEAHAEEEESDIDDDDDDFNMDDDSDELKGGEDDEEMLEYMQHMDQELARTRIGESFEKEQKPTNPSTSKTSQNSAQSSKHCYTEEATAVDEETPVNVDLNLVKNLLESFTSQQGLSGPASNILNAMGVRLPVE